MGRWRDTGTTASIWKPGVDVKKHYGPTKFEPLCGVGWKYKILLYYDETKVDCKRCLSILRLGKWVGRRLGG